MTVSNIISMIIAAAIGLAVGSFGWTWWLRRRAVHISADQLLQRIQKGDKLQIVDVRTEKEFAQGHIKGAKNLPMKKLKEANEHLKNYVETIVICDTGRRSLLAYHELRKMGFKDLRNVSDGMVRWRGQSVKSS